MTDLGALVVGPWALQRWAYRLWPSTTSPRTLGREGSEEVTTVGAAATESPSRLVTMAATQLEFGGGTAVFVTDADADGIIVDVNEAFTE